jgi:kynurenine formamidase
MHLSGSLARATENPDEYSMHIIDLTHPVSKSIPVYFPWHPATVLEQTANYREHSCVVTRLVIGTHTGTHIDAPSHIFEGMHAIDGYDPSLWYLRAQVLDFTPRAPRQEITVHELKRMRVRKGGAVILKTGWDRYFGRPDYYATYPPLGADAAEYLVNRGVRAVAADTPFTLDVHKILLKEGVPLITNLNNTGDLKVRSVRLVAAPLLIQGGDGAPARVFAVVSDTRGGQ